VAGDVGTAPAFAIPRSAGIRLARLAGYDLLLCALLGFMAAARLWLVPGYLRADTWLALTAGRDIRHSGIPHHETLTALAAGREWIDQQWLAHIGTYGLYAVGGFALTAVVSVMLAVASLAAMATAARSLGARARTVLLLMPITAFPFFAQSWQPRTQMFAYPLFAAVFLLLLRDARSHSARVMLTLPLLVLWANLHGSAALGAGLVSLQGALLLFGRRAPQWRALALLAAPLALVATPYGIGTARYYRATLLDPSFKKLATEWQPIVHDPVLVLPFMCIALLACWTLLRGRAQTTLWERLALIVLVVAAATALRNMVWLTLGALPVLALAIERVVPADPPATRAGARINTALAAGAALAIVTAFAVTLAQPAARFESGYPLAYLHAIQGAAAVDPGARIVADVGDADWLLWRDPGLRGRVAFDARLELLPSSGVHDIASLLRGSASSLRGRAYRIFALDRTAAAPTMRGLLGTAGRRIVFEDARRIVVVLPAARPSR
jgi:hypothetical protein